MNTADPHAHTPLLHHGASLDDAQRAVVLLHGRGATADDILQLAPLLDDTRTVAFLAPQAAGDTWYPQRFIAPRSANEPYLGSALRRVDAIIDTLHHRGFDADRLTLAGFSQGACLTSDYLARSPGKVTRAAVLTGGLIGDRLDRADYGGRLDGVRVNLSTGDPDPHIPVERVSETADVLRDMGADVTLRIFRGRPHTVAQEEVEALRALMAS